MISIKTITVFIKVKPLLAFNEVIIAVTMITII